MKMLLIVAMLLSTTALVFSASTFLSDRHMNDYGLACVDCHEEEKPEAGAWVDYFKCMACHDSWEELAKGTAYLKENNPHASHLGEIDCTLCHKGHSPSEVYCVTCHTTLEIKMK